MNNSESHPNTDNVASGSLPWPDSFSATGDYPYVSAPQSTHPDLVSAPGYFPTSGSYIPDFNAAHDAAFTPTPTIEMGAFPNPPTQEVDHTYQVSKRHVHRHLTYLTAPQNAPDTWPMLAPCMSLS